MKYELHLNVTYSLSLQTHPDGTLTGGSKKMVISKAIQTAKQCAMACSEG